jgi:hypothetical protein
VILGLVIKILTSSEGVPALAEQLSSGVLYAAILMPAGFFLSVVGRDPQKPNRLIALLWIGAASLTVGVVSAGSRADHGRYPVKRLQRVLLALLAFGAASAAFAARVALAIGLCNSGIASSAPGGAQGRPTHHQPRRGINTRLRHLPLTVRRTGLSLAGRVW